MEKNYPKEIYTKAYIRTMSDPELAEEIKQLIDRKLEKWLFYFTCEKRQEDKLCTTELNYTNRTER